MVTLTAISTVVAVVPRGASKSVDPPRQPDRTVLGMRLPPDPVDNSVDPPRRSTLRTGDDPTPCEPGSDVLKEVYVHHAGKYLGVMRHRASYQCAGGWFEWENADADFYYGFVVVRTITNEQEVRETESFNNAQRVLVGPFVSSVNQCVRFVFHLVLRDGTATKPESTVCKKASRGAGVPVESPKR